MLFETHLAPPRLSFTHRPAVDAPELFDRPP